MDPLGFGAGAGASMGGVEVLLGIDGGGPTTQAVVADLTGRILGRGLGPVCNHRRVGFETATKALATAIEGALGQVVGLRSGDGRSWRRVRVVAACFGLAGVDSSEDRELMTKWIRQEGITPRAVVVNDSELVLIGGTPEGWGIGLISGTGSVCLGRSRDGRSARAGGWGYVFGDEGSGYAIATEALRLASHTADGRAAAHGLLKGILNYWRLATADDLIGHVYRTEMTTSAISELAIGVQELAGRGDPDAVAIVEEAAKALAAHVDTVVRKLQLKQPPLALGGASLRAGLKRGLLANLGVEIGPITVVQDPAQAAVTIAQRELQALGRVG
jgi:N-acetylglucosamine kinase-like BadF-type ATPase